MKVLLFLFGVILFLGIIIHTESAPQTENHSFKDVFKNMTEWGNEKIGKIFTKTFGLKPHI